MIQVTLMMAITLDGKIARTSDHAATWTSPEDKALFVKTSKDYGVIMMGENTFNTFLKALPGRLNVVFSQKLNEPQNNVKWVKGEPELVLAELENMGYNKVLLVGGAYLNGLFFEKKLVSEMIITIEPKMFGQGLSLFDRSFEADLELLDTNKLNDNTLALHYKINYK